MAHLRARTIVQTDLPGLTPRHGLAIRHRARPVPVSHRCASGVTLVLAIHIAGRRPRFALIDDEVEWIGLCNQTVRETRSKVM